MDRPLLRGPVLRDRGDRLRRDRPDLRLPTPEWNPYYWDTTTFVDTLNQVFNGPLRDVFVRTGVYVLLSLVLCIVIGYPVAYYIARYGRRRGAVCSSR